MLGIIIQARLGSTRLPNKMILPFHNNEGVLEIILNKIKTFLPEIPIVVATTTNGNDDIIAELCKTHKVKIFRGSEENVIKRFTDTAKEFGFSKIIRICADNPFINMNALKELLAEFKKRDVDYCSFQTSWGTPSILTHYGFWAEGVSLTALEKVSELTDEKFFLEHITNYIYSNPKIFKLNFIPISKEIEAYQNIRMTMDTKEDFLLLQEIYKDYYPRESDEITDLLFYVSSNEDWMKIMNNQIELNTK